MLKEHRAELDRLCAALLERESLERDDLTAILGPGPTSARAAV
jgi:ATP-dependent Zn protease